MKVKMIKGKNKKGEQIASLIGLYGSLKIENQQLRKKINDLEQRVTALEITRKVGF